MELKSYLKVVEGSNLEALQKDIKRILLEKAKPELVDTIVNSDKNLDDCSMYIFDRVKKEYQEANGTSQGGTYKSDSQMFEMISHYFIDEPKYEEKKPEPVVSTKSTSKKKGSSASTNIETEVCDFDDDEEVVETKPTKPTKKPKKEEPSKAYQQMSLFDEEISDDNVMDDFD